MSNSTSSLESNLSPTVARFDPDNVFEENVERPDNYNELNTTTTDNDTTEPDLSSRIKSLEDMVVKLIKDNTLLKKRTSENREHFYDVEPSPHL